MKCKHPTPQEIRRARLEAGLTQEQAARIVCSKRLAWARWESGERKMHPVLFWYFVNAVRRRIANVH